MRVAFDDSRLAFHLGDVRDMRSVHQATHGVDPGTGHDRDQHVTRGLYATRNLDQQVIEVMRLHGHDHDIGCRHGFGIARGRPEPALREVLEVLGVSASEVHGLRLASPGGRYRL